MQAEGILGGPGKEGRVLVAMDTRPSGPLLSKAVQLVSATHSLHLFTILPLVCRKECVCESYHAIMLSCCRSACPLCYKAKCRFASTKIAGILRFWDSYWPACAYRVQASRSHVVLWQGIVCVPGGTALDLGILTTPQLHWMVRSTNRGLPAYESDYYNTLTSGYRKLVDLNPNPHPSPEVGGVLVDGANGVGAQKLGELALRWASLGLHVEVRNDGRGGGELNHLVGADFVQKEGQPPQGFGREEEVGRR